MKLLKRILLTLLGIVVLILIIAAFMDKSFHVERETVISKPSHEVYNYIRYLKNQDNYSVWNRMDANMQKAYKGTDGTVGFVYSWDSKNENVGAGEQEIRMLKEGQRVECALRFKRPFESEATAYMTTERMSNNSTRVTWAVEGTSPWPFNFFMAFMDMDGEMGKDLEDGLENLRGVLETGALPHQ